MKLHPLALLALALACQKPGATPTAEVGKAQAPPVAAEPLAGSTAAAVATVRECPQSLGGQERVHRVISKECGVVEVTEDYEVDGGSLTLEAGTSLSFKDGARLIVGSREPAKLIVQGTTATPVVLTTAGDRAAGAWGGVRLHEHADGSTLAGVVIEFAGDEVGALVVDAQEVSLTGVKLRETRGTALRIGEAGSLVAFTDNEIRKTGNKTAIDAPARALGGLGRGNRFDAGAQVQVRGGAVETSARWQDIGAALVIAGAITIDGKDGQRATVELMPGLELRFTAAGGLDVGGSGPATLLAKGTAEAPITFTAQEQRAAGAWGGLGVHAQGEAVLERVVLEFGGKDETRGSLAVRGGQLSLTSTTFRGDRVGVTADEASRLAVFSDNKFVATPIAVVLPPSLISALGEDNAYDRDSRIKTAGGPVTGKVTWLAQGVPIEIGGPISVDAGELVLAAGVALLAAPEGRLIVGVAATATLRVEGTAGSPVTIGPLGVGWPGLTLAAQARGNVLENLVLTGASAASAIEVAGEVDVELRGVTCSRCSGAVVGWSCGAKVTSSQVLAADGTPMIDRKPEGC